MEALLLLILVFSMGSNAQDHVDSKNEAETPAFEPVGCFKDSMKEPRPLPELIKNFRWPIKLDWSNLNLTIQACAREVKKIPGYKYFGVQFYGECWSGPRAQETYDEDGNSSNCVVGVGMARANFVYKFKEELPQECSKSKYTVLDSIDRAMTEKLVTLKPCDYTLKPGWYRFEGRAGNAMANTCVKMYHCGTLNPAWLQGVHPAVKEGVVTRRACFHQYNKCCYRHVNVQVRNCGPFYLYELPAAPSCQLRYCGNGKV